MPYDKFGCLLVFTLWALCLVSLPTSAFAEKQAHRGQTETQDYYNDQTTNRLPNYIDGAPLGEFLASRSYLKALQRKALKHEKNMELAQHLCFKDVYKLGDLKLCVLSLILVLYPNGLRL